ncbi:SAM-dependent methyltransferase [Nocardioides thalensis]|uniref:SAM-dependent methyltransferase n=1 Tax=Nocardioides thalensis TaxID=1914755 RepID=A0A853C372_9ACTN|nr:methyltransferase domain-containing protein [Nocardioides thalensis]NYJ01637.1 SAM-dependent methyltransferase [Nocardioides thalensis]
MPFAPPDFLMKALSRQLGGPSGLFGKLVVARKLNQNNGAAIAAAVEALELAGTEVTADVGFGGGLGLDLLLTALPEGQVHGVEPSRDMLALARRTHEAAVRDGRLTLHEASMQELPMADGALDGWISLNTVYFVKGDLAPAARELARVLAPSGRGVLGIADPDWMAEQPFTRYNFNLRPVPEVVATFEEAGLAVERREVDREGPRFHLLVCRPTR